MIPNIEKTSYSFMCEDKNVYEIGIPFGSYELNNQKELDMEADPNSNDRISCRNQ